MFLQNAETDRPVEVLNLAPAGSYLPAELVLRALERIQTTSARKDGEAENNLSLGLIEKYNFIPFKDLLLELSLV